MTNFKARQKRLSTKGSFLVFDKKDILYYTGYMPSSSGFLLIKSSGTKLFASTIDNDAKKAKADVVFYERFDDIAKKVRGKIGLDYDIPARFLFSLRRKTKNAKFYSAQKIIKEPRTIKDSDEIEKIRKAVRIGTKIQDSLKPWDKKEADVANEIEISTLKAGAKKAFPPIVSDGKNSCHVHHSPDNTVIKKSPVVVDMGAVVEEYHSDRTRVFMRNPTKRQNAILEDVKNMQGQIIDFIEPGKKFTEVQNFWETLMKKKGYKVLHSFGHGIGLEIHEQLDVIKRGSVLTVEPGVYDHKHGGFRIEDIVLVKNKANIIN